MREISMDTETTGLEAEGGDRIVEIGCVEMINHVATGHSLQLYIDPLRPMSPEATAITGLTDDFLRGKPTFDRVAQEFVDFIGDDKLVIHNAPFDIGFINMEFRRVGIAPLTAGRVVDTLPIARKKFPGSKSTLDALCSRFGIDNSAREKHGALLDAELLAEVYLELLGGKQPGLGFSERASNSAGGAMPQSGSQPRPRRRSQRLTAEEKAAHQAFIEELGDEAAWSSADLEKRYRRYGA